MALGGNGNIGSLADIGLSAVPLKGLSQGISAISTVINTYNIINYASDHISKEPIGITMPYTLECVPDNTRVAPKVITNGYKIQ